MATVFSISYSGEPACAIHAPIPSLYAAHQELREAGATFAMKLFCPRAIDSMRMEKGLLHGKSDVLTEFDPFETGLERFVRLEKANFIGKKCQVERSRTSPKKRLVTLAEHAIHAPAPGGAFLMEKNRVSGTVSFGDWGHRLGLNLAYAFVYQEVANRDSELQLDRWGS